MSLLICPSKESRLAHKRARKQLGIYRIVELVSSLGASLALTLYAIQGEDSQLTEYQTIGVRLAYVATVGYVANQYFVQKAPFGANCSAVVSFGIYVSVVVSSRSIEFLTTTSRVDVIQDHTDDVKGQKKSTKKLDLASLDMHQASLEKLKAYAKAMASEDPGQQPAIAEVCQKCLDLAGSLLKPSYKYNEAKVLQADALIQQVKFLLLVDSQGPMYV